MRQVYYFFISLVHGSVMLYVRLPACCGRGRWTRRTLVRRLYPQARLRRLGRRSAVQIKKFGGEMRQEHSPPRFYSFRYCYSMKHVSFLLVFLLALLSAGGLCAQNTELQALHVEGRYLCLPDGTPINLHGFGQTYSPWFNEQGRGWGWSYNTDDCLRYNQGLIDKILDAGCFDYLRYFASGNVFN